MLTMVTGVEAVGHHVRNWISLLKRGEAPIVIAKSPVPEEPVEEEGINPPRDLWMPHGGRHVRFKGKNRFYVGEHYMGADYDLNLPLLKGLITSLNTHIYHMPLQQSKAEINEKMNASGANAWLFRPEDSNELAGFAIFRRMRVAGHWFLLVDDRSLTKDHRGQHLGRLIIPEELGFYREDLHQPIEALGDRTQSAAAALSIIESDVLEGGLLPFSKKYNADPELQTVLRELYRRISHPSSLGLNEDTGFSRGEYIEGANRAYQPDQNHPRLMAIHNQMDRLVLEREVKGDRKKWRELGHAFYCMGWVKRPHMDAALGLTAK